MTTAKQNRCHVEHCNSSSTASNDTYRGRVCFSRRFFLPSRTTHTIFAKDRPHTALPFLVTVTPQCTGPRAPTPETFAEALFNDTSSWAVMDRGPMEALVPVTRVIENTMEAMSDDSPDKAKLQVRSVRQQGHSDC